MGTRYFTRRDEASLLKELRQLAETRWATLWDTVTRLDGSIARLERKLAG